ncbi:MAG: heme biosynthesis HemY N-terminal domain-containing protein [Candidatus Puniceispirillales bacterium]
MIWPPHWSNSMRRIIGLIIWILIIASLAHVLASQEGVTRIDWLGWRIETHTSLLVAALLFLIWLVMILDRVLSFIANVPHRISGGFSSRRGKLGRRALALGMAAAAAGEGREAMKHARKSVHYLGHDVMTDLLMAQASSLSGDTQSARRYFHALTTHPDTAYYGHIGHMRLALEAGDEQDALTAGREALALKPRSASIANALFVLEAKAGEWDRAEAALNIARHHQSPVQSEQSKEAEAIILLEKAKSAESEKSRQKLLGRSIIAKPDFLPAILAQSDLFLANQQTRKATALLEKHFLHAPHPATAELLMQHWSGNSARKLVRLITLTEKGGQQKEALLATAKVAFDQELWGEANRLVHLIPETDRDARVWQLLADLAEHHTDNDDKDKPDSSQMLRHAALAPRQPEWRCHNCHSQLSDWHAICPQCQSFASIKWQ